MVNGNIGDHATAIISSREGLSFTPQTVSDCAPLNLMVKEYWIVNPINREIYLYGFEDFEIKEYIVFKEKDILKSQYFKELEVSMEKVFPELKQVIVT